MSDAPHVAVPEDLLHSPRSRKHFLKGAAVAAASLGIAPAAASAAGLDRLTTAGMGESAQEILNIAATAEAAAVTALYHVHLAVGRNQLNVSGVKVPVAELVSIVRAALREEQDHYAFITGAGGKPLFHSFTFPAGIFAQGKETLEFFIEAETIFIAAYMAATAEFAGMKQPTLARYAYQIGGVECEHRTLMRAGLGLLPPNNKSFETHRYGKVAGAARTLQGLGIFHPNMPYPGAKAVDAILAGTVDHRVAAGVVQRHP